MPGAWLAKIGSWIARKETFERMVVPAIADMQVEASYGGLHRWKHYVGIGLVLVHALLQDLRFDISSAFDAEARRLVWKRAAIWYAGSAALFTFLGLRYNLPSGLTVDGIWSAALASTALEGIVTGVSLGMMVAVFYLCRRSYSRRTIVPAVLIVVALTIAFALAVRPVRMSADRTLYNSIQAKISHAVGVSWKADDLDEQVTWWKDIQSGVSVIPSALLGVVLARRRGWKVAATVAGIFATWILVVSILLGLARFPTPSLTMQGWREIALNFVVAVAWLTFDRFSRRERQPAAG